VFAGKRKEFDEAEAAIQGDEEEYQRLLRR
jgi:hypothetical protein